MSYVELQFRANLCGFVWRVYLFVRAMFGSAYRWRAPDSLAMRRILSEATMQQIGSLDGLISSSMLVIPPARDDSPPVGLSSIWNNLSRFLSDAADRCAAEPESSLRWVHDFAVRKCQTKNASRDEAKTWLVVIARNNGSICIALVSIGVPRALQRSNWYDPFPSSWLVARTQCSPWAAMLTKPFRCL